MYEKIFKKFDQLVEMLSDLNTEIELVYRGKGAGEIIVTRSDPSSFAIDVDRLALFSTLGHLHHILTLFLDSSYDKVMSHELDEQLEYQETH